MTVSVLVRIKRRGGKWHLLKPNFNAAWPQPADGVQADRRVDSAAQKRVGVHCETQARAAFGRRCEQASRRLLQHFGGLKGFVQQGVEKSGSMPFAGYQAALQLIAE